MTKWTDDDIRWAQRVKYARIGARDTRAASVARTERFRNDPAFREAFSYRCRPVVPVSLPSVKFTGETK